MMKRYKTVLNWFKEYGFEVVKENDNCTNWCRTLFKDKNGKIITFEITNNHIWRIKGNRISYGKTKTELYSNLDKLGVIR